MPELGLPFDRLGEFRLLRTLGRGGMGVVYLAEQESLGRLVALKVVEPEFRRREGARERFEREIAAVARLQHANIVTVHAAGEERDVQYLAMEYVPGRGLDEVLAEAVRSERRMPVRTALRLAAQIARALECAHAEGILHRDVKPTNIRVRDDDGRAMLLDFGLARSSESTALTRSGAFQGTPHYASPEQIRGHFSRMDGRADVFSLGVVLYRCLTGRVPFEGDTIEEILHRILSEAPAPPRRTNAALPRDVQTVVLTALEKDPSRRYSSAAAFADDLDALLEFRPIRARPPGPIRRLAMAARRHVVVSAVAALVLVAAVSVGATRGLDRVREERLFRSLVATARQELDAGRTEAGLAAAEEAARQRPDDGDALRVLTVARRVHDRSRAVAEVDRARAALAGVAKAYGEMRALEATVRPLQTARRVRWLDKPELDAVENGEPELARLEQTSESATLDVLEALHTARLLDPKSPAPDEVMSDLYMQHWRRALENGDDAGEAAARERVQRHDVARRHAADLAGRGSIAFDVQPPGAIVHLFRYVEQSALNKNGERRLVPVAVRPFTPPKPYGIWVLRVVRGTGDVATDDLILSVGGWPVRNTVLVLAGDGGVRPFDRLASIDGNPVRETFDVWYRERIDAEDRDASHVYRFERKAAGGATETRDVVARTLAEAGIEVISPAALVARGGVPVTAWHGGESIDVVLGPGVDVRTTATPLFVAEATRFGAAPIAPTPIDPGSYLAVIEAPGFETERVPCVVDRRKDARVEVELLPAGTTPYGFVHVHGGAFSAGGDAEVGAYEPGREPFVPGFFIQDREVTFAEYVEFLNDPDTRARVGDAGDDGGAPVLVPRAVGDTRGGLLARDADGTWRVPAGHDDVPVYGVSFEDALAYAEWRTRRAEGSGLRFMLPTSLEWEKAARGVDGRVLVCGRHFVAQWMKSRHARPVADVEPVLSFPVDESPYGVFDLGGGVNEWCSDPVIEAPDQRIVRGGAWSDPRADAFRAAYRQQVLAATTVSSIGFRLVARHE